MKEHQIRQLIVALVLATAISANAAPGDLDPTFAGGGKFSFGFGGAGGSAHGVVVQGDGKIVAVGSASVGGRSVFAVTRYHPDGARDATFGGDGEVLTDVAPVIPFATVSGLEQPVGVALQSDGKIVVAGTVGLGVDADFALLRYNADGALDDSFGSGGRVTTDFGTTSDLAGAVRLQGDGKILVAGFHYIGSTYVFVVARFLPNGSLDDSFHQDGKMTWPVAEGNGTYVGLTLQSDGKILVAGSIFGAAPIRGYRVLRLNVDGSPDTSFDLDGMVQTQVGTNDTVSAVAIQAGGESVFQPDKIVVSGYSFDGAKEVFSAVRYHLADGSLDTSFDGDGKVMVPIGLSTIARALALRVEVTSLLGRRFVLAGLASRSTGSGTVTEFVVVRLNLNGSPDTTFDQDGVVTTFFNGKDLGMAVAVAGGRIIVAGESFAPSPVGRGFALARYNSDGSLDLGFDGDGKRLDYVGGDGATAAGVARQPDGKIVLGGTGGYFGANFSLARLLPDGSFDLSFDADGKVGGNLSTDRGHAVALQPDGKILLAGSRDNPNTDLAVARFNSDGSTDTSFAGGVATTFVGTSVDVGRAIVLQPDGKIVVAGYGVAMNRDTAVVRFHPNGALDETFDFDGKVFNALSAGDDEARAAALQADGKIVIAGVGATETQKRILVARLNPNGSFDTSFDQDGVVITSLGGGDSEASSVALEPGGRILVGGYASNGADNDFALLRYNSDGSPDPTFNGGGSVLTPISPLVDRIEALALQADSKIIAVGSALAATGFSAQDFAIARYHPDGSLDAGFGTAGTRVLDFDALSNDSARGVALDEAGRIVIVGEAGGEFAVARLEGGPLPTPTPTVTPTPTAVPSPTPSATPLPNRFVNISTRLRVETGDNVLIGGFIVTGSMQKRIMVRAIGPSLPQEVGPLANPLLELYDGSGNLLAANDNWQEAPNAQEITDSTIAPLNELEAAILQNVELGPHTAIVRDVADGEGVGLVEVYDLGGNQDSKLANISTRGRVQTGDNVMIGGLIASGSHAQKVILRAIGPSLGIAGQLEDPFLELFDANGAPLASNDNWKETQQSEIEATTIPPTNDLESAIVAFLPPALYTAIVSGVGGNTGIGLVEVYALQ